jgi:Pyruvate/2-oxoacid:ferredoxin oxidoreductase delta subunit
MSDSSAPDTRNRRLVIEVNQPISLRVAPAERPRLRIRTAREFPGIPQAYLDVARRLASPLLSGPPLCDELVAFVQHLLTEEEAAVMRHLSPMRGRGATSIARAEHRSVDEVEPILRRLALDKRCIAATGSDNARRYQLMPVIPGIFEMVLIGVEPAAFNDWHRRFIELFEALYNGGYIADYRGSRSPAVRFLPLAAAHGLRPSAVPASHFGEVADRFKTFAVGQCQCRMTMNTLGHGCGRPLGNCTIMGTWAESAIRDGWARQVSREEILAIKAEAEAAGLVSWVLNVKSGSGQASCSCCGCCCHAMRMVSEFNAPGWFAPPRLRPSFDEAACTSCGRCTRQCPMNALTVQPRAKRLTYLRQRCIGCGLCSLACPKKAIEMRLADHSIAPYTDMSNMFLNSLPDKLRIAWRVWRKRAKETPG